MIFTIWPKIQRDFKMNGEVQMKFSTRGDAHKLYLRLREMAPGDITKSHYLKETGEIKEFYQSLDSDTLQLIYYQVAKEKGGIGIIPIFATAIPWLLVLFSKPLEDYIIGNGNMNWMIFGTIYLMILTVSLIFHFKENAWAVVHSEIIKDILEERRD